MNNKYLDDFYIFLSAQKRYSLNTIKSYKMDLSAFFTYVKKENLSKINHITIQSYFSSLYVNRISMKTISRKLSALKSYGKFLNKSKNINCDFLNNINLPKKEKTLPEYLSDSELDIILHLPENNIFEIRNSLIIHLLYSSGIRLSELTGLKVADFSNTENIFKVLGKGNKQRIVIYSAKTKLLLDKYLELRKDIPCPHLLLNKNHSPLTNRGVQLILETISKNYLGHKNLHPHMLRHTFATKLLNKGMDIRSVQELLGHDSLTATQIYTHVAKNQLADFYKTYHPRGDNDAL